MIKKKLKLAVAAATKNFFKSKLPSCMHGLLFLRDFLRLRKFWGLPRVNLQRIICQPTVLPARRGTSVVAPHSSVSGTRQSCRSKVMVSGLRGSL